MIRVKVFRERDGKPVDRANVYVCWGFANTYNREGKTDAQGEVLLDVALPQDAKVIINNSFKKDVSLKSDNTFFV